MQFSKCQVTINNRNILASDASISEQNNLAPIYALGTKGTNTYSTSGPLNNQIQINYLVEPDNEVNLTLLNEIKNYNLSSFPVRIIIGGITGAGYLSSLSYSVQPNDVIGASVTYNIYTPLTGQLSNQPSSTVYNLTNGSGIAHSYTTYPKMANGSLTGSLLNLNYSCEINWGAKYKIGNPYPAAVKFLNATENFDITHEYPARINYTGQSFNERFYDIEVIEINPLSGLWTTSNPVYLYPASGKVTSNKINIRENDIIVNETIIIKNF
jgi:hypothetical protein